MHPKLSVNPIGKTHLGLQGTSTAMILFEDFHTIQLVMDRLLSFGKGRISVLIELTQKYHSSAGDI
jgi:hypothetical protein